MRDCSTVLRLGMPHIVRECFSRTRCAAPAQANKTASFMSDTTASAVQATQTAAETIKQGATTPLGKKKSPLGPFGGS